MRSKDSNLIRSQQSISEVERDDNRTRYLKHFYTSMLIKDVSRLIPIGGQAVGPFSISITPEDPKVEELIIAAITQRNFKEDLAGAVCDFFHQCSETIMAFREASYEIVYLSEHDNTMIIGFELRYIQPLTIKHRLGKLVQYVLKKVAHERKMPQYIQLSPERILTFKAPSYVQKNLNYMMESLSLLSNKTLPDFALPKIEDLSKKVPFDFKVYLHAQKLALADAVKLIGWNARGLLQKEMLEYYYLHRQLLFERFKIELRNSILKTLNEGLDRAGKIVGFSGQLEIKGLPTIADVDAAKEHLIKGDKSFNEILEPFLKF